MFLFEIANFKNNQIMIFLNSHVPMSKFGAKVELRCNDGIAVANFRPVDFGPRHSGTMYSYFEELGL